MDAASERISRLLEVGRFADARSELQAAIARDPDTAELHGLLARALLGLGDAPGALAAASRLVKLAPDDEWGHRLRSIALVRADRPQEALAAAAEAVRRAPFSWQAHMQRAQAGVDAAGHLHDALQAAQRAVELAPDQPDAHNVLGLVHAKEGEDELARAAYLRALELAPGHSAARNNLAVLDGGLRLGRQTRGFLAALRADPQSQVVHDNLDAFLPALFVRVWLALGVGLVVAVVVTTVGGDEPSAHGTGPTTYAILAVTLLGCSGYAFSVARHLPSGVLRELWRRRHRTFVTGWDVVTVLLVAALAVVCVVPEAGAVGFHSLRFFLLGLGIRAAVRSMRRRW
ncbi:tetratricopeptide repeat protein [Nocardioides sp. MH1]|uniref:tetratricopeptide repeat protein n=1 Tax=Nocardioides sp. MH1 TaxID=3242490 RepID=UPI00351FA46C